jgi:hypothetical protein
MTQDQHPRARVDLYTAPHKGVRTFCTQTAKDIQTADFTNPEELRRVADSVDAALRLMAEHAQVEESVIHKALRDREPELVETLEATHREIDALAEKVRAAAVALRGGEGGASLAATTLDRAYSKWLAAHLAHMVQEEETSQPALWKHFDDGRLAGLRAEIQGAMAPERLAVWMRLFFRGMSAPEVGDMLAGAKAGAPPPVYERMARLAEEELGPRWESAKRRGQL